MTSWGPSPSSSPVLTPWEPPAPSRARRGPVVALVVALVLLVAGAGAVLWWSARDGGEVWADAWDPRLASLVEFVEGERDLEFRHPVHVEYLSDQEWASAVTGESEPSEEDLADARDALELLRAIGLAEGDVDLVEQFQDFATDAYVAYYDFDEKYIAVHADDADALSTEVRVTLVHELTHALQDQHFDIASLYDDADESASFALESLVEGDAVNVEQAFVDALPRAERDAYFTTADESVTALTEIDVPVALRLMTSAPYDLGPGFAYMLRHASGDALDDAFHLPPSSDEHVFDPASFLDDRNISTPVEAGSAPDGAELVDDGTFGALSWFIVLAERIDAHEALRAADGWGGDAYVAYREQTGNVCVDAWFVGDTNGDNVEMREALEAWVASLPFPFAEVRMAGDAVRFRSCDPGADAELETGASIDAMALPVVRSGLMGAALEGGLGPEQARCFANAVVAESTVEELSDPDDPKWTSREFEQRTVELVDSCL